jgi:hypothetical protein
VVLRQPAVGFAAVALGLGSRAVGFGAHRRSRAGGVNDVLAAIDGDERDFHGEKRSNARALPEVIK